MSDLLNLLLDVESEAAVDAIVSELSDDALASLHAELEPDCRHDVH